MNEIWKDIEGYMGIYQVSNLGNVKSLSNSETRKEKILKPAIKKSGYFVVGLYKNNNGKQMKVHQLVAMAFLNHIPCGYKFVVNHKDFNKLNNHVSNLEIVTQRENSNRLHLKSSSSFIGVSKHKLSNKWQSHITINGRLKYLGLFINELDASIAYQNTLNKISGNQVQI